MELSKLLAILKAEDGYQEKASNSQLDSKNGNVGYNNYTKYARDINKLGLMGCQGQAWCGTYSFWGEVKTFGVAQALKNFCMTAKNYCAYSVFSTREKFRAKGKYVKTPKVGYRVIFKQSHTGVVIGVTATTVTTIEGNTSAKYGDRNGGTVKIKTYSRSDSNIDGYCAIEYPQVAGWVKDNTGWWYRNADGSYPKSKWQKIAGKWYYFNTSGYAVSGWQKINNVWYLLAKEPSCAMLTGWQKVGSFWYYLTPGDSGALKMGWIKLKDKWYYLNPTAINQGYMVTGWQTINGKRYYLRTGDDGSMVTSWFKYKDKWYYFNGGNDGSMVTSKWITWNNKEYYLQIDGIMASNQWIGNKYVGDDGAWQKGKTK